MGLGITLNSIASAKEDDEEWGEAFEEEMKAVNRLLVENGYPEYSDPESCPDRLDHRGQLMGFSYSAIHYLRRALAYLRNGKDLTPVPKCEDPSEDPVVEEEYYMLDSHLICHSDCEGYYVPVDFPETIFETDKHPVTGGMLGSSYGLKRELIEVAPLIDIQLDNEVLSDELAKTLKAEQENIEGQDYRIERQVWFTLFEFANDSIKHGLVISFG